MVQIIEKAAINFSIKQEKSGKFVKRHAICAKTDLENVLSKLKSNPNVKNIKIVEV